MSKQKIIAILGAIVLLLIALAYNYFHKEHKTLLLQNSIKKEAVLIKNYDGSGVHDSTYGIFEFVVGTEKIRFQDNDDYRMLQVGDTVLIRYSIENHSVATVIDKDYMKKYKSRKNKSKN